MPIQGGSIGLPDEPQHQSVQLSEHGRRRSNDETVFLAFKLVWLRGRNGFREQIGEHDPASVVRAALHDSGASGQSA
jgi:hypothetical protein